MAAFPQQAARRWAEISQQQARPLKLWIMDESRFGLPTVQRRRITLRGVNRIWAMAKDPNLSAARAGWAAGTSHTSGAKWVTRFNEQGLAGLADEPRGGRPRTHDETVRSRLLDLALQKLSGLGYPFALWTLERLQHAFCEREGIHLSDSTIWEWMAAEGFRW